MAEGSRSSNDSIRGAKFVWKPEKNGVELRQKHVFTHFINLKAIQDSIDKLDPSAKTVQEKYGGQITEKDTEQINRGNYKDNYISKTTFLRAIVDAHYVEEFNVEIDTKKIEEESIITIYKTGVGTLDLLRQFGIDMINAKMVDEMTLRLNPDEIRMLQENAPYLIAMDVKDFSEITREDIIEFDEDVNDKMITIPKPGGEPVIGVIDTQFDESVYFHEWVKYENKLSSDFEIRAKDCKHGTAVSSIIVDGPAFNPKLDDGSFRVGYGIVPKRIEDILHSKDDEIRFIMTGSIDEYETYTYNIAVPQDMNAHPYFAKATLAYFPKSDRNQGVDYTSTEMDIHFGRIMGGKEASRGFLYQGFASVLEVTLTGSGWLLIF